MLRPLPAIAASLVLAACERGFLPLGGRFEVGRDPMVIFVGGDAPAGGDLYALEADGGGAIPLTFSVVGELRPSLSPDGGQVAFLRGATLTDSMPASVWVLNLVNGAERPVCTDGLARARDRNLYPFGLDRIPNAGVGPKNI